MKSFAATFIVASLGYFVDIYDLILFGVVRIESLKAIGISPEHLLDAGMLSRFCTETDIKVERGEDPEDGFTTMLQGPVGTQ